MRSSRWWLATLLAAGVLVGAGCGDDDDGGAGADGATENKTIVVSAAASLTEALNACKDDVGGVTPKLSFAGSDELAAQIRQGVKPDVFLSANTKLPDALRKEGRLGEPVEFASNELVVAVPKDSKVASIEDLGDDGVTVVLGSGSVPFGSYTREVLGRLPNDESKSILDNVRSNEPDVKSAVGKLTQGAADASFTYNSDVEATDGKLKAIKLPEDLQPVVAYGAGVVEGAKEPEAAQKYLDSVTEGACRQALMDAGFGPPSAP
jgi:molybdate transport system substrate-binding protein